MRCITSYFSSLRSNLVKRPKENEPSPCLLSVCQAIRGDDITVKSYRVESRITSRFAHTTIRSSVINSNSRAQSIGFSMQIPKRANVNGITFVGSVKEKTVARRLYAQATARNKAAGIDMETFNTEVHVPPGSNIEFELHYQEMMERKLGLYEHFLYLEPGRLVPQFQAHVVFKPNLQQQRKCENCTGSAIDGVFSVKYDVTRDSNAGELQVSHIFTSQQKHDIYFTVEAMKAILDDLNIEDRFSIIDFNHNVRCWSEDLVPASSLQITDAKRYIQNIKPNGGEIKLSKIQKNVKRVMTEEFSLFSLGIGFDVDYDFLERIAMENRGMAQRIYANHDAAEQIRV
ncbi:hypothetical protein XENOCAPTIV_001128 [Xenoophorus captivus]|uniref:VIT domain-containing protein n=1 Tax=Xenoophorus captivus TaxID=1517983 RepID=A0ABV0R635_9TELE